MQGLQRNLTYHGQLVTGVAGLDRQAPGLLQLQFSGSSPAMEAEGASIHWARSVERNKLRYTVVISDGDAKSISRLNNEHPYSSDIVIQVITFMLISFIFIVI